jgi:hypothetical protein
MFLATINIAIDGATKEEKKARNVDVQAIFYELTARFNVGVMLLLPDDLLNEG